MPDRATDLAEELARRVAADEAESARQRRLAAWRYAGALELAALAWRSLG